MQGSFEDITSQYLEITARDDVVVVKLMKALLHDDENIEELYADIHKLIDTYGFRKMILDMSLVEYLTSHMLGKLIMTKRQLHRLGGSLVLSEVTSRVQELFITSSLTEYFKTADSLDEACKMLVS